MRDRLAGVSVFVEAVEAGGFAAAAERLNLSRSAVGKTVARLEDRLGVRLFHRTTRAHSLTEDGQIFYERCLRALDEIRSGETLLDSGQRRMAGRLRVSMPVLFGRHCVAPILLRLAAEHPDLALELAFNDRPVDLVEDGIDLAVRTGPLGDDPRLMARRIASQRLIVVAAPSHVAAEGTPRTLDDLRHHDAIVYRRAGRPKVWRFPGSGTTPIEIAMHSRLGLDDLDAIADAAVAGFGLALLPCWLVRERIRTGRLVGLLPDIPGMVVATHALWPQAPHLPLRIRLAIDRLAAELPQATDP